LLLVAGVSVWPVPVLAVAALVGSSLARVKRSVMRPGVVSLMVAKKVAWFIGAFHRT
jgi:hypothetical protein